MLKLKVLSIGTFFAKIQISGFFSKIIPSVGCFYQLSPILELNYSWFGRKAWGKRPESQDIFDRFKLMNFALDIEGS